MNIITDKEYQSIELNNIDSHIQDLTKEIQIIKSSPYYQIFEDLNLIQNISLKLDKIVETLDQQALTLSFLTNEIVKLQKQEKESNNKV